MTTENTGAPATPATTDAAAQAAAAELAKQGTGATGNEGEPKPKEPAGEPTDLPLEEGEKAGTFAETGDQGLDMALAFVGKNGFGPGHPAIVAAVKGDFSILRAQLAEKNVPGAEAYMALAEKAYEKFHAENESRRAEDKKAVLDTVGGEQRWAEIQTWAKANAEPAEAEGLRKALAAGGFEAKMAATFLSYHFDRATGGVGETDGAGPSAAGENKGAAASASNALSPQDYGKAVLEARNKHNPRQGYFEDSKVYKDLRERRARWKA